MVFSIEQLPLSQAYHLLVHYQMSTLDKPHYIQIDSLYWQMDFESIIISLPFWSKMKFRNYVSRNTNICVVMWIHHWWCLFNIMIAYQVIWPHYLLVWNCVSQKPTQRLPPVVSEQWMMVGGVGFRLYQKMDEAINIVTSKWYNKKEKWNEIWNRYITIP